MKFVFFVVTLFFLVGAQAQVRKCIGPDGKVTYSDFICSGTTVHEKEVKTNANTIDASGSRKDVQRFEADEQKARTNDRIAAGMQNPPTECKFSYYTVGDEKGKVLAANAKEECLRNLEAKKTGQAVSLEQYNLWKDHRQISETQRSRARVMNCNPNGAGGQYCY